MIDNPQVFPHPMSQNNGITLLDMIMLSLLTNPNTTHNINKVITIAKDILSERNKMIRDLETNKNHQTEKSNNNE